MLHADVKFRIFENTSRGYPSFLIGADKHINNNIVKQKGSLAHWYYCFDHNSIWSLHFREAGFANKAAILLQFNGKPW